jgi:hypothetical protein
LLNEIIAKLCAENRHLSSKFASRLLSAASEFEGIADLVMYWEDEQCALERQQLVDDIEELVNEVEHFTEF